MADKTDAAKAIKDQSEARGSAAPDKVEAPQAGEKPKSGAEGAKLSNADIDLTQVSRDSDHASYVEDPNLDKDVYPRPGRHVVQVLGEPQEEGTQFEQVVDDKR